MLPLRKCTYFLSRCKEPHLKRRNCMLPSVTLVQAVYTNCKPRESAKSYSTVLNVSQKPAEHSEKTGVPPVPENQCSRRCADNAFPVRSKWTRATEKPWKNNFEFAPPGFRQWNTRVFARLCCKFCRYVFFQKSIPQTEIFDLRLFSNPLALQKQMPKPRHRYIPLSSNRILHPTKTTLHKHFLMPQTKQEMLLGRQFHHAQACGVVT